MPLLKCNSTSYSLPLSPSKRRSLSPLLSLFSRSRCQLVCLLLSLRAPYFSLYSLNNRTAASGRRRRRGVTSKRLFRKMQMRVPLFRPLMMLHPPAVIKRVREDNLRTEEIDVGVYLCMCVCVYAPSYPPSILRPFVLSLMRTRTFLRLSTLIRYFDREVTFGERRWGTNIRVVARQTFRQVFRRRMIIEQNLSRLHLYILVNFEHSR